MGSVPSGAGMSKMQNTTLSIIKVVTVAVLATLALCLLTMAGVKDYQARAEERQAILDEAQYFKSHPLVLHGCSTDIECEKLDAMLDAIHASYN